MTSTQQARFFAALALAGSLVAGCSAPSSTTEHTTTVPCDVALPRARVLRQPVLRLSEHGDWGAPIQGAGIPTFSLYEDGLVVYAEGEGDDARPMQAHLSPEEVYALVDLANAKIGELPEQVSVVTATDQPLASIGVTHGGRIYSVNVYGFGEPGTPEAFTELHDMLRDFTRPDAEPWQPDELDVVLYRKSDLEKDAKPWPSALPLPPTDSREPRLRVIGRKPTEIQQPIRYRIDGELEPELGRVLPPAEQQQAFQWRGTAWLVRTERVLPARTFYW
jgi:hypothetical protein